MTRAQASSIWASRSSERRWWATDGLGAQAEQLAGARGPTWWAVVALVVVFVAACAALGGCL